MQIDSEFRNENLKECFDETDRQWCCDRFNKSDYFLLCHTVTVKMDAVKQFNQEVRNRQIIVEKVPYREKSVYNHVLLDS